MEKDKRVTASYSVPAVERAIDILEYMVEKNSPVTIQELTGRLGIPKASAFRIFKTLQARGYLVDTDNSNRYILGPRVLLLGSRITKEQNLRQISSAHMFALANRTRQTVQLGILFGYRVLYIDQVRTSATDIFIEPTGTPFEVNISAGGKAIVAFLPSIQRKDFLSHAQFASSTEFTITCPDRFRAELEKVARDGFAIDDQEFAIGIRCVAAPIFDSSGACIASVGITGHLSKLTDEAMPELTGYTVETAKAISRDLGHQE
jgi:DNA-binding IclR family transcriptional regulator